MTEYLVSAALWWDGGLRSGDALRIEADGRAAPVPLADVPAQAARRDLPGTLLPALIDAHVHSGLVDLAVVRAGGIAAVWDLGSVPAKVAELAARDAGLPRIRFAGPFLTAPGGYPSDRAWAAPGSWREIRSAADGSEAVAAAHASGATLIKVAAHAGGPQLGPESLAAVVGAAHDAGLPVVVHAEGPGTVATACEAGADLLAHTPWSEPLDDGLVRTCAERMEWISTLDIHGWGTPTPAGGTAIGNLRRFRSYGGSVRYGTDLGNGPLPPGVNPRELRALQAAGLTPDEILRAMTDPAQVPGICWIPGGLQLEPAPFADVLATARVVDAAVRPRA
ncbi:MAG TPA: amidohydrolase [Actinoplanes sp.]